ncbi:MAG TPA: sugar porter family MFS transporter [Propionibacteriaceae bacterium]|nr:sugar porter family MFS transporter [Propionibacteriaceae bacterium]
MTDPSISGEAAQSSGRAALGRPRRGTGWATGIAALGGLLFGYDTGIISSALLYFPKSFGAVTGPDGSLVWDVNLFGQLPMGADRAIEVIVACLLLGALLGALTGGAVADAIGRRPALLAVSAIFVIGAVVSGVAPNEEVLLGSRLLLGYAIGVASVAVPLYIAEIAPRERRGRLVSMNQLMVTAGIFLSYLVGYALAPVEGWRLMLALAGIPALLMLGGLFTVSESPRWLVTHGRAGEARAALMQTRSAEDAETEMYEIVENAKVEQATGWSHVLDPRMRRALTLGLGVAAVNQLVGVNAVIYYLPRILSDFYGDRVALLITLAVGFVNMVVTYAALSRIDRWGRRPLILGGTLAVAGSLIVLALLFLGVPDAGDPPLLVGVGLAVFLCVYIAAFAASLGLGIWLINSEVYPTSIRGRAAGLGSTTHWLLDLVIAVNVLTLVGAVGAPGLFAIFAALALAGAAFLGRLLPETKGKSLEQLSDELVGSSRVAGSR